MEALVQKIRADFPILQQNICGHPLVYLDNAATMQIPVCVSESVCRYYGEMHANVHRGIHTLSERATAALEDGRKIAAEFINAEAEEIIFTSGTTQALNDLARMLLEERVREGDNVIVTIAEHHSNFVPWQQICKRAVAEFRVVPLKEDLTLDLQLFEKMLDRRTKVVAFAYCSNVTGAVNPVKKMTEMAHQVGAIAVIDAAQAIRHQIIDVKEIGCDALACSGHKMMAPTGTGFLYVKRELSEHLLPAVFGGGMVGDVHLMESSFADIPQKFEAGTPNIGGVIGLKSAIAYMKQIGRETITDLEQSLLSQCIEMLKSVKGVEPVTCFVENGGVISFNLPPFHSFDVATLLDKKGIAVRSGHHCAQPLMQSLGINGTVRLSPAFYNTKKEILLLYEALEKIRWIGEKL